MAEYEYVNGFNITASESEGMVYLDFSQAPGGPTAVRVMADVVPVSHLVMRRDLADRLIKELSSKLDGS